MRLNAEVKIIGSKIVLVPYRKSHVLRYHEWMEDDELRELTASQRLSLEEEFENQQSWLLDDKSKAKELECSGSECTFIVLDKDTYSSSLNEEESMIGDANLYLSEGEPSSAEIGVMIAESRFRRQGRGREATLLLIKYGVETLALAKFSAKISTANTTSIALFQQLQFHIESQSDVFKEVTLSKVVDQEWLSWLRKSTESAVVTKTYTNC